MEKNDKIVMITAVSKALEYRKVHPSSNVEEIINFVIRTIPERGEQKIGAVAAVSRAVKYKEKNPRSTDKEVMQKIVNELDEILNVVREPRE